MINYPVEQHTQALADYLPGGRMFEAKNVYDSEFRKLLRGIAFEFFNAQGYIVTLNNEYLPDETVLFIEEWEQALGIPDDCFEGTGTLNERRRDILAKLAALGVQTAEDFEALGDIFETPVTVTPLSDETLPAGISEVEARYIFVVEGPDLELGVPPYDVPFDLIVGEAVIQCLINKLKPGNCRVIYRSS